MTPIDRTVCFVCGIVNIPDKLIMNYKRSLSKTSIAVKLVSVTVVYVHYAAGMTFTCDNLKKYT